MIEIQSGVYLATNQEAIADADALGTREDYFQGESQNSAFYIITDAATIEGFDTKEEALESIA